MPTSDSTVAQSPRDVSSRADRRADDFGADDGEVAEVRRPSCASVTASAVLLSDAPDSSPTCGTRTIFWCSAGSP